MYGDGTHRSHMQSIIDRLQAPQSLEQTARELGMLAARSNHAALTALLQTIRPSLQLLEAQLDEVIEGGGKGVYDFVAAAVSVAHCCLSLLQQQQQPPPQPQHQTNVHRHAPQSGPGPGKHQYGRQQLAQNPAFGKAQAPVQAAATAAAARTAKKDGDRTSNGGIGHERETIGDGNVNVTVSPVVASASAYTAHRYKVSFE